MCLEPANGHRSRQSYTRNSSVIFGMAVATIARSRETRLMLPDSAICYIHRKPGVFTNTTTSIDRVFGPVARCSRLAKHSARQRAMQGASWAAINVDTPPVYAIGTWGKTEEKTGSGWEGEKRKKPRRKERRKKEGIDHLKWVAGVSAGSKSYTRKRFRDRL